MMRLEIMEESPLAAVGHDFVVDVEEDFRRQHLDLEAGLVAHAARAGDGVGVLSPQPITEQPPGLGQWLVRGSHLRQVNRTIAEGNDVAGPRNTYGQFIVLALDFSDRQDIEKLGVKRPPIHLKGQVAHPRANNVNAHDSSARPPPKRVPPMSRRIIGTPPGDHNAD